MKSIKTERLRRVTGAIELLSLISQQLAPPCRKAAFKDRLLLASRYSLLLSELRDKIAYLSRRGRYQLILNSYA